MHQSHQRLRPLALIDGMMMCDNFDDIIGQLPLFSKGLSGVAVAESHGGLFCLVKRDLLLASAFHGRGEFLGKNQTVHHEAQVMEQAGHVGFFRIGIV
jgi:hypothetical protein